MDRKPFEQDISSLLIERKELISNYKSAILNMTNDSDQNELNKVEESIETNSFLLRNYFRSEHFFNKNKESKLEEMKHFSEIDPEAFNSFANNFKDLYDLISGDLLFVDPESSKKINQLESDLEKALNDYKSISDYNKKLLIENEGLLSKLRKGSIEKNGLLTDMGDLKDLVRTLTGEKDTILDSQESFEKALGMEIKNKGSITNRANLFEENFNKEKKKKVLYTVLAGVLGVAAGLIPYILHNCPVPVKETVPVIESAKSEPKRIYEGGGIKIVKETKKSDAPKVMPEMVLTVSGVEDNLIVDEGNSVTYESGVPTLPKEVQDILYKEVKESGCSIIQVEGYSDDVPVKDGHPMVDNLTLTWYRADIQGLFLTNNKEVDPDNNVIAFTKGYGDNNNYFIYKSDGVTIDRNLTRRIVVRSLCNGKTIEDLIKEKSKDGFKVFYDDEIRTKPLEILKLYKK